MLKLTYTENSFSLQCLDTSLEKWVNTRVTLALRAGTNIYIESSTVSFLISTHSAHIVDLETLAKDHLVQLSPSDADFMEVVLQGTWLTSQANSDTGIFVTVLNKSTESLLQQISQSQQFCHA
ncbi:alr0857 family protein [Nostoc sp. TCL26-01]|uniref:alr0857 family protein n=1 Tax=Nostoc sp. TCL26-01 TaxID=2576904 RepID=UPI0015BD3149|nr:alr0857 family protein [Nostoc sp. TCL26-01]QLE56620.1 hypothetical protein FD725_14585 [Nostoc sp. TCL26-01]